MKAAIPWAMIGGRALLGVVIIAAARLGSSGHWLATIVLAGLLSDIYDGILARRWHCETVSLRRSDSLADTVFYLGVATALWIRDPALVRGNWKLLAALFTLEIARYVFDFLKFGKAASYHSYLAKAWGLLMAIAIVGVLSLNGFRAAIPASIALGIAANLEGLTMSIMLPEWRNDVRTLPAAARLRRCILAGVRSNCRSKISSEGRDDSPEAPNQESAAPHAEASRE